MLWKKGWNSEAKEGSKERIWEFPIIVFLSFCLTTIALEWLAFENSTSGQMQRHISPNGCNFLDTFW